MQQTKKTLTEVVYDKLRLDIVAGNLAPSSKLKIEPLSKLYKVGASPVREALSRLASEGFVNNEGMRGFNVAPISVADLKDVTETRLLIELKALEKSILNGDEAWESEVVAAFYQLSKTEGSRVGNNIELWEERNRQFHLALISACNSNWLLKIFGIMYDQHKRYRNISLTLKHHSERNIHQEHQNIYDAALARDVKTALKETEAHIVETAKVDETLLAQIMR